MTTADDDGGEAGVAGYGGVRRVRRDFILTRVAMLLPAFLLFRSRMSEHGGNTGAGKLRVYHLALEFCEMVDELLTRVSCSASLRDQLERAAESIVLNIAEGAGHYTPGKKRYHYQLSHGSAWECLSIIARLRARNPTVDFTHIRQKGEMISTMMVGLLKTVRDRPA